MIPNDAATRAVTQNGTDLQRGRAALIALWLTQVALAVMFLMAGGSKLAGVPAMVSCELPAKTVGPPQAESSAPATIHAASFPSRAEIHLGARRLASSLRFGTRRCDHARRHRATRLSP